MKGGLAMFALYFIVSLPGKYNISCITKVQHDKSVFSHVVGVSPDSKVDTDPGGETNKIISKLDFISFLPCVLNNFSCVHNNFVFLWLFCVQFSAAWLGLFQVTTRMVPM